MWQPFRVQSVLPRTVSSRYPVDTFRWYICREAIYGCDLSFSKTSLVLAHNAELCNTFGNLVHRSLSLMDRYNKGEFLSAAICFSWSFLF